MEAPLDTAADKVADTLAETVLEAKCEAELLENSENELPGERLSLSACGSPQSEQWLAPGEERLGYPFYGMTFRPPATVAALSDPEERCAGPRLPYPSLTGKGRRRG